MTSKKLIITSVGSAMLGGLAVGYLTVGPMASAGPSTLIDGTENTVTLQTEDDTSNSTTGRTDDQAPPSDAERDARRTEHLNEVLAPLVTDGTITQAQADSVIEALIASQPEGGPHGRGPGRGGPMGVDREAILEVAATAMGVTADDLKTQLQDGQTLAEVAASKGVDAQKVIDALVADATTRIDAKVTAGEITAERAADIKADLVERTTRFVNEGGPHRGKGGEAPADADTGATGS